MENIDLNIKEIWNFSQEKWDRQSKKDFLISKGNLKIKSNLSKIKPSKKVGVILGILWIIIIDTLTINLWMHANWFFIISAILQSLITKIGVGLYIYQIILINQVDGSNSVIESQKRISELEISTLWVARILTLQLPLWTIFYINSTMIENGTIFLWVFQCLITLAMLTFSMWLFVNIKYENKEKKWFKFLIGENMFFTISNSIKILEDIHSLENIDI